MKCAKVKTKLWPTVLFAVVRAADGSLAFFIDTGFPRPVSGALYHQTIKQF